jgi:ribosomal protein L37E
MKKLLLTAVFAVAALAVGQVSAHNHGGVCNEVVNPGPELNPGTVCSEASTIEIPETVIPAQTVTCPSQTLQCPTVQCPDCVCKTCPVVECQCTPSQVVKEAQCPTMSCNRCGTKPHKCHRGSCSSCGHSCSENVVTTDGGHTDYITPKNKSRRIR